MISEPDRRSRRLPFPRWDLVGARAAPLVACRSRAVPPAARCRCWRAAAARSSAPIVRTAFWRRTAAASSANILDELTLRCTTLRHVRTSSFAIRCSRRTATAAWRCATGFCARGLRPAVRVRDAPRPARRRICSRRMHAAGLRAMSFGVESVSPDDAEEGRTAADPGRAPADDHRRLPSSSASSPPRSTSSGSCRTTGSRSPRRSTTRSTLGSTVAQFKLLTPYPGTPLWKQMSRSSTRPTGSGSTGTRRRSPIRISRASELQFLLGAAYTRFYMRPSCLANCPGSTRRACARCPAPGRAGRNRPATPGESRDDARAVTC